MFPIQNLTLPLDTYAQKHMLIFFRDSNYLLANHDFVLLFLFLFLFAIQDLTLPLDKNTRSYSCKHDCNHLLANHNFVLLFSSFSSFFFPIQDEICEHLTLLLDAHEYLLPIIYQNISREVKNTQGIVKKKRKKKL